VAQALAHELERAELETYLAALAADHGAVPKAALAAARRAWPKR
jgi:hypothetical protein